MIQRIVVIVDGDTIKTIDLPDSMRFNASVNVDGKQSLDEVVSQHISNIMTNFKNNKTQGLDF
jgi:hypothetical protein